MKQLKYRLRVDFALGFAIGACYQNGELFVLVGPICFGFEKVSDYNW